MRLLAFLIALVVAATPATADDIRIGNKSDIETSVLGEVLAELARQQGHDADANAVSGGSGLVFDAIAAGEIDAYVEYTGTLIGATLSTLDLQSTEELRAALAGRGLSMTEPLGFNNTYALAVPRALAEERGLVTTSDLADHPDLRVAISTEWSARPDGWPSLRQAYGLPFTTVDAVAEHRLLYAAVSGGQADVIEVYTTEAAITENDLVVLEDDRGFFPQYEAFVLYRSRLDDTHPQVVAAWMTLAGTLDETQMTSLNAIVEQDKRPPAAAAKVYLEDVLGSTSDIAGTTFVGRLTTRTIEHLWLVVASMAIGIAVAVPLGVLAAKNKALGQVLLGGVGILQTIPSLALLVFMVPLLGLGAKPAIAALFLYALLPMVRNTHAGLTGIAAQHARIRPSPRPDRLAAAHQDRTAAGTAEHPGGHQDVGRHHRRVRDARCLRQRRRLRRTDPRRHAIRQRPPPPRGRHPRRRHGPGRSTRPRPAWSSRRSAWPGRVSIVSSW